MKIRQKRKTFSQLGAKKRKTRTKAEEREKRKIENPTPKHLIRLKQMQNRGISGFSGDYSRNEQFHLSVDRMNQWCFANNRKRVCVSEKNKTKRFENKTTEICVKTKEKSLFMNGAYVGMYTERWTLNAELFVINYPNKISFWTVLSEWEHKHPHATQHNSFGLKKKKQKKSRSKGNSVLIYHICETDLTFLCFNEVII